MPILPWLCLAAAEQRALQPASNESPADNGDPIAIYGPRLQVEPECLVSGVMTSGTGRRQFCIDVPSSSGQKLVLDVRTARPAPSALTVGDKRYLQSTVNASSAIGPIIEVKPFQMACERCDLCPCIGCGHRCECSCNANCRVRRESSCAHTAGVLTPGRWYVGVDAPGDFTLRPTLVAALQLRAGERLPPRTLWGAGATQPLLEVGESEGKAFSDYLYFDPAPHQKLTLKVALVHTGSAGSWIDVYVRFGDWPTTELHDAAMRCDKRLQPVSAFVLEADRLINERLHVLILGRGDASVQYRVDTETETSPRLLAALAFVGAVGVLVALALLRIFARERQTRRGDK